MATALDFGERGMVLNDKVVLTDFIDKDKGKNVWVHTDSKDKFF